jgi:hypothetical protein
MAGLQGERGAWRGLVQRLFAGQSRIAAALSEHDPAILAVRTAYLRLLRCRLHVAVPVLRCTQDSRGKRGTGSRAARRRR